MRGLTFVLLFSFPMALATAAQAQLGAALPAAIRYEFPTYPALARQARVEGEVRLEVITDGQAVVSARATSGHQLLAAAAEKNAKSWRFAPHEPAKFTMTYQYKLSDGLKGPPLVTYQSPGIVEVTDSPPEVYAVFGRTDMGTWKIQTTTAWGTSEMTMKPTRGPYSLKDRRESLEGKAVSSDGESFHIEYGMIDGFHVQFVVPTRLPNSGTDMVFFRGELNGETMVGTFSNATGTEGTWTAKRIQSPETQDPVDSEKEDQ